MCAARSFTLERAVKSFGSDTIHLAVVDPGVGTSRRLLVVEINGSIVVCPDNGLITWSWRKFRDAKAHELSWRPGSQSNTFHGRDVMAPVAGMIAAGHRVSELTGGEISPELFFLQPSTTAAGEVIHIDHFGNATTNIPAALVNPDLTVAKIHDGMKIPIHRTYGDVNIGEPLALIGSSELLEVAVRNGSAADRLQLKIGDMVSLF